MNRADCKKWRFHSFKGTFERETALEAYWEVELGPISDDYTPDEIGATELLSRWAARVRKLHAGGLVPIFWFVAGPEFKLERMPFQSSWDSTGDAAVDDFLTYYSWPLNAVTGEVLNWLTLPVADKLWDGRRANKGGFIQQATGWKPAVLQPMVYLPSLLSVLR